MGVWGKVELVAIGAFISGLSEPAFFCTQYSALQLQYRVHCSVLCCNSDELVVGSKSCDQVVTHSEAIKTIQTPGCDQESLGAQYSLL